jgi:hypothetical protein
MLPRVASSLFVALAVAGAIVSSCGGESAATKEDFIASYCDKYMPCCEKAGRPSDGAQCRAFLGAFASGTYDPKAGEACLEAFDEAAADANFCDGSSEEFDSSACAGVFDPATGDGPPGSDCTKDSDCAHSDQGEVRCEIGFDAMGGELQKCQVQIEGKVGDSPCVATVEGSATEYTSSDVPATGYLCNFAKGMYCDSATQACAAVANIGDACTDTQYQCGANGYCDDTTSTCAMRKGIGASCETFTRECAEGSHCDQTTMTCTALLTDGSPCTSGENCEAGACVNGTCGSSSNDFSLALICGGG